MSSRKVLHVNGMMDRLKWLYVWLSSIARYVPELQAFPAFSTFLKTFPEIQYPADFEMVSLEEGDVLSWPGAVQYLLRNYASSSRISSALADPQGVSKLFMKMERELIARPNQIICGCGNVYPQEKVLTFYIDALHPKIRSVAGRYRKSRHPAFF